LYFRQYKKLHYVHQQPPHAMAHPWSLRRQWPCSAPLEVLHGVRITYSKKELTNHARKEAAGSCYRFLYTLDSESKKIKILNINYTLIFILFWHCNRNNKELCLIYSIRAFKLSIYILQILCRCIIAFILTFVMKGVLYLRHYNTRHHAS
jgi:hypothetical protein